jgi:predicted nucleic acid-binding Zn ribbon protein
MTVPQAQAHDPRPMRRCYKCGREIGPDESICSVCNRAGMATPSATQYHGTIVVAIIAGVVLLAVLASLALRGVGPYSGTALDVRPSGQGIVVATVRVTNEGTKAGRAKCEVTARDAAGHPLGAATGISPEVPGGSSVTFDQQIAGVDSAASVSVNCQ